MYIVVRVWKPGRKSYYPPFCMPLDEYEGCIAGWDHEYMIVP